MPRVLIVDDEPGVRRMVGLGFELEGFEVETAADGADAIVQVQLTNPDVVIMDIMMPRLDGLTALGHIRRQPATASLPVLLLSAKAESADIAIGIRAGADDYVTKPFDMEDLVARARQVIEDAAVPEPVAAVVAAPALPLVERGATAATPTRPVEAAPPAPRPVEAAPPPRPVAAAMPVSDVPQTAAVALVPGPPPGPVTTPRPSPFSRTHRVPQHRARHTLDGLTVWAVFTIAVLGVTVALRWQGDPPPWWAVALAELGAIIVGWSSARSRRSDRRA